VTVAALYVETGGAYFGLDDVDPWDVTRDARNYDGPYPVVAHPPCNRWVGMAYVHPVARTLIGQDGGTFAHALDSVRRFGGVLEHPAHSFAWDTYLLPVPELGYWQADVWGGWTCEVDQGRYGHIANKPTWLYYVGDSPPPQLDFGGHDSARSVRNLSKTQRHRTPPAFRDALLDMARSAAMVPA
jgi:hypothetical protein